MTEEVKSGNVTYRNDKYRIPTTYNWLPATGAQGSQGSQASASFSNEGTRVSTNNIYKRAVRMGKFNGSYSDFLSQNSDVVKKYQGEDQKVSDSDTKVIISMLSPGEVMANADGPEKPKEPLIMGVKPWVFYTGLSVVLIGAGFGVYKLLASKK